MTGATARRRAGVVAGAAVSVIAALVLAGCSSANGVASPTPSLTFPSPSVTPTKTIDADGRALPGFVTASVELPAAEPAPAALLPQTTAGWSLQSYRPQVEPAGDATTPGADAAVQVVYAVSPQGQRYQLLELDATKPIVIESWSAGETVAYVTECEPLDCDPAAPTQRLDLLTGELSPVTALAGVVDGDGGMRIGATIAGSYRWWQNGTTASALEGHSRVTAVTEDWIAASISPDGTYLAAVRGDRFSPYVTAGVAVVNVTTGALTDVGSLWDTALRCEPFRWRADDALDVNCFSAESQEWSVYTIGPGAQEMKENASATATPPEAGPWVQPEFFVSEGVWAGPFTADADARLAPASSAIGLARNAGFEQLTVPDAAAGSARILASVAGVLYVEATQADNSTLTTVWAYNVAGDAWTEVAPLPPAGPTRGPLASQGAPAQGLTSVVVAP